MVFHSPSCPTFWRTLKAAVKSAKKYLRQTIGKQVLSFEELFTLFYEIGNVLNSRLIRTISEDPKDEMPITLADLCSVGKLDYIPLQSSRTPSNTEMCFPMKRWAFRQNLSCGSWTAGLTNTYHVFKKD